MAKEQLISANDAVLKIQLSLLKGIRDENRLFAAGSLLSRSDYEDVVTERSIANLCGYPLCNNRLPEERPNKGRYRISLKEHKVYDLQETYLYCSSRCVINSRAFAGSLQEKRIAVLNSAKIDEVLKLFEEMSLDKKEGLGKKGDLGFSELKIEENLNVEAGEVLLEDWLGPSNAIEGYVPNLDFSSKPPTQERRKEGPESNKAKPKKGKGKVVNEMDFTSTIIVGDQFAVPKFSYGSEQSDTKKRTEELKRNQFSIHEATSAPVQNGSETQLKESKLEDGNAASKAQKAELEKSHGPTQSVFDSSDERSKQKVSSEKLALSSETTLKSSLNHSGPRRFSRSVTWADERKIDDISIDNLNNVQEMDSISDSFKNSRNSSNVEVVDGRPCLASEAAIELTPSQVAKAITFSESDVTDDARPIIKLQPDASEGYPQRNEDVYEQMVAPLERPKKPGALISESFDAKDSSRTSPTLVKEQSISLKDAVHKIQLSLTEGIHHENLLFAAQSLMSRSDYDDVITKRSITNVCGYPLCNNPLPAERPRKNHYRPSLKHQKAYDPREIYIFCSPGCVTNSRAFAGSLPVKRCSVYNSEKIKEVLKLFEEQCLKENEYLGVTDDLTELKIQEKVKAGDVLLENSSPFFSIEGYIPEVDGVLKSSHSGHGKGGAQSNNSRLQKGKGKIVNEMDLICNLVAADQFTGPKLFSIFKENGAETKSDEVKHKPFSDGAAVSPAFSGSETKSKESDVRSISAAENTQFGELLLNGSMQNVSEIAVEESKQEVSVEKTAQSNENTLKSSLKPPGAKTLSQSVTWADKIKVNDTDSGDLCTFQEINDIKDNGSSRNSNVEDVDASLRLASAEACALALSQSAEAVSSGELDISDAESDAGIIILPQLNDYDEEESQEEENVLELETVPLKLPNQPGLFNSKLFDPENSWYDAPPNGFSLTLSSFATMWTALFGWITSSSLAYIYGRDVSSHEEFILVNGKEYPRKIFSSDGRSSEIKESLAGILARMVPELVAELKLRAPLSALEHGMECLLDTMSFMDPLPSLGTEQWHVLTLLFIDALSVCRIPGLAPHMTSMRVLLHKVLDSAQVTWEEYESMKDVIIPLGRRPQFSAQSGA